MENAVCFGKVTLCQESSDRLYFSSRPGDDVKTDLKESVEDENISTVGSEDQDEDEYGRVNDTAAYFSKLNDKISQVNEVMEYFVKTEYTDLYDYLAQGANDTKKKQRQMQVYMCLAGDKDDLVIEFYKDA